MKTVGYEVKTEKNKKEELENKKTSEVKTEKEDK
jgi:hypothetical protein